MLLHCFFVTGAKVRTFQKPTKVLPRFLCVERDFFEISPRSLARGGVCVLELRISRGGRGRACTPFLAHRPTARRSDWR